MVNKISEKDFKELLNDDLTVVDFSASWCGPCKMLAPVIDEISKEYENIKFYNLDVDECDELVEKYNISSVPTIIILKNKEEIDREIGFKTKDDLTEMLNKHI